MTDDALGEIAAIRRRVAELEQMLADRPADPQHEVTSMDRLTAASAVPPDHAARRQRQIAEGWRHDPEMEHLARLAKEQPEALSPSLRMSVGVYLTGKAARAELGHDTTGGTD